MLLLDCRNQNIVFLSSSCLKRPSRGPLKKPVDGEKTEKNQLKHKIHTKFAQVTDFVQRRMGNYCHHEEPIICYFRYFSQLYHEEAFQCSVKER